MNLRTVLAQPLSVEAFAPFGSVISTALHEGVSANQGNAVKFNRVAALENLRAEASPNLAVFRSQPLALPLPLRLLERHPFSSQAFIPLVCQRYLVCVAPNDSQGEPELSGLQAFVCGPGQGINYRAGVWHHPIVALDACAEFAMLAYETGGPGDCEERPLLTPIEVRFQH